MHVIDPTLFFDKEFYLKLINKNKVKLTAPPPRKKLFAYIVKESKEFREIIKELSISLCYEIIFITTKQKNPVNDFINGIDESEALISNSFHGTIFAIIFNKPFLAFFNDIGGNERLISLNNTLCLGDRFKKIDHYKINNDDIKLLKTPPNVKKRIL